MLSLNCKSLDDNEMKLDLIMQEILSYLSSRLEEVAHAEETKTDFTDETEEDAQTPLVDYYDLLIRVFEEQLLSVETNLIHYFIFFVS